MQLPKKLSTWLGSGAITLIAAGAATWLVFTSIRAEPTANRLYDEHCASCHSDTFTTQQPQDWLNLSSEQSQAWDESFAAAIRNGQEELGMPGFAETLSEKQIRALVVVLREHLTNQEAGSGSFDGEDGVFSSEDHSFRLERLTEGSGVFWSMDFLPRRGVLITEKSGGLYCYTSGDRELKALEGTPEVMSSGQGGMLDVLVHPHYAKNGWIFLAFSEPGSGMTSVVRGRIKKDRWVDEEVLFRSDSKFNTGTSYHFGTRMVWRDGYLFFGIGDRGRQEQSQDLSRPNGKIHRIHEDGRVPEDNPFADVEGSFPTIWTYGNRNPQGLTLATDGALWQTEHGPRGGDEVNLIERGENYGWPILSHGINYSGTPFAEATEREGFASPLWHWTPSIAVSNLDFYDGEAFAAWQGDLLIASLGRQELRRLKIDGESVVADELLLKGQGRIRDVRSGPDGLVYLLMENRRRSWLSRMSPVVAEDDESTGDAGDSTED